MRSHNASCTPGWKGGAGTVFFTFDDWRNRQSHDHNERLAHTGFLILAFGNGHGAGAWSIDSSPDRFTEPLS